MLISKIRVPIGISLFFFCIVFVSSFAAEPLWDSTGVGQSQITIHNSQFTIQLITRWRWAEALDSLNSPRSAIDEQDALFLKGYLNLRLGKYTIAESLFALILGAQYDLNDWVNVFLAQSAFKNGDYETAYQIAKSAGKIPGLGDTLIEIRWRSLWNAGKKDAAIAELDTLQKIGLISKWFYKYRKAIYYRDIGKSKEAKEIFTEILHALAPSEEQQWLVRIAAREFSEMSDLTDDDKKLLGTSFYDAKDYESACKWLDKYSKTDAISQLRYYKAVSLSRMGEYDKAIKELNALLKKGDYDRSAIWWRIGYCKRKQGERKDAIEALDSAVTNCDFCGNRYSILKERLFLYQELADYRKFADQAAEIVQADKGGNLGSAALIWTLVGNIITNTPDSSVSRLKDMRANFRSPDFLDEVFYWEARTYSSAGDTSKADSIYSLIAGTDRSNLFVWLSRMEQGTLLPLEPQEFTPIADIEIESLYASAKIFAERKTEKSFSAKLPEDPLRFKAEHLVRLGLLWLAEPCFYEMEKEGILGETAADKLELWRYYCTLGLYDFAARKGAWLCDYFGNECTGEILRLRFLMPYKEVVEETARRDGIDPYFIYAVMLQESRFDPYAQSYADAMGIMQFIEKTGATVAKWLNIGDFDKTMLFDYETGISLGSELLEHLLNTHKSPYLALGEYNAGDKHAGRWSENCPMKDDDILCAEMMDIQQTRLYAKYIMGYYYTYHWLYGGTR